MAKHYIIIDDSNCIQCGFSDDFEQPEAGAICINEDGGRHFEMNGVTNPPLMDSNGVPLYKFVNGEVVERTPAELEADKPVIVPIPMIEERTEALENAMLELIMGGIV